MQIRRATGDDLDEVASLLRQAERPPLPVELPLANVLLALEDGAVAGVMALRVVGLRAWVGPEAVAPGHSDGAVRTSLLQALLARALELSLRELYAGAGGDEAAYAAAGFAPVAGDDLPAEIRASRPPGDAGALRLRLATRFS